VGGWVGVSRGRLPLGTHYVLGGRGGGARVSAGGGYWMLWRLCTCFCVTCLCCAALLSVIIGSHMHVDPQQHALRGRPLSATPPRHSKFQLQSREAVNAPRERGATEEEERGKTGIKQSPYLTPPGPNMSTGM